MSSQDIKVAIIGSGIVGLIVGMGLAKRGVKVGIYEQSPGVREIGAGVAFTANAIRCMGLIDPTLVEALRAVATPNGDPDSPTDHLQWVDGLHQGPEWNIMYRLDCGYRGFEGCHRAHFVDEILKRMDGEIVHFGKKLVSFSDDESQSHVRLDFEDGSTAAANIVVGCDGIKSQVRKLLFGGDNPVSYPRFSHKVAFRALVPMEKAEKALGPSRARRQHMHIGPDAHVLHFPVASQTLMNVVAFVDEPGEWVPAMNSVKNGVKTTNDRNSGCTIREKSMVAPATRQEVEVAFANWGPGARAVINLLPEEIDRWAIFDMYDHPIPTYTQGRVCLAGDAAHASAPHHGAGAGIGVEDSLALCTLLEMVLQNENEKGDNLANIKKALKVYDEVRRERSQWLVKSSREVCEIYEGKYPATGTDMDKCFAEIKERSHKLWYFDIEKMLADTRRLYKE
ncbi:hypothetical protein F5Y19DRAFT_491333 [Xylariaceae sp. FL1651]|nr:hypothetical protein F5Y19DRAFT_491333 [Xylariaceae sp. FL1651]